MAEDRRTLWVALNLVLSDSLRAAQKVVAHFPDLENIFRASSKELTGLGVEEEKAVALTSPRLIERASRTISWLAKKGYFLLTVEDPDYPSNLREIFDPPFVIYAAGRPEVLEEPSVAVVGARRPTPYGRAAAEKLAKDLGASGLGVVSGLARGMDSTPPCGGV